MQTFLLNHQKPRLTSVVPVIASQRRIVDTAGTTMSSNPKSPQDKKRLSYERDRRNAYGENAKASRKNIPRSKALGIRCVRHEQNQALRGALTAGSEEAALEAELRAKESHPRWWAKDPDKPLGEVVARKLSRRRGD